MSVGYGIYVRDEAGEVYLAKVNKEDERACYEVCEGCVGIFENALKGQSALSELYLPSSVKYLPDGCLSNSGSWAEIERGLQRVIIDEKNKSFYADSYGVFERFKDGLRLILYLKDDEANGFETVIKKDIVKIGKDAFFGRKIHRLVFEADKRAYSFPSHAFFNEELLKSFGKNGKLYDFEEYDKFLLRSHFNADRIRMLCERLMQEAALSDEKRGRLKAHVSDSMKDVLTALGDENAADELKLMAEAGFFTGENIDEAIDILNRTDRRELLTHLMDYKHSHLKTEEFDFSV